MLDAEAAAAVAAAAAAVGGVARMATQPRCYEGEGEGEGELCALASQVAPLYASACRDPATGLRAKVTLPHNDFDVKPNHSKCSHRGYTCFESALGFCCTHYGCPYRVDAMAAAAALATAALAMAVLLTMAILFTTAILT